MLLYLNLKQKNGNIDMKNRNNILNIYLREKDRRNIKKVNIISELFKECCFMNYINLLKLLYENKKEKFFNKNNLIDIYKYFYTICQFYNSEEILDTFLYYTKLENIRLPYYVLLEGLKKVMYLRNMLLYKEYIKISIKI